MKKYSAYKPSGVEWVEKIPSHWNIAPLKRGLSLLTDYEANGSFASAKENVHIVEGSQGYAWYVRATDLESGNIADKALCKWVDEATYQFLRKTYLASNDLLVVKRGEIGKVYLLPKIDIPATLAPNMYLLRLNNKLDPEFAYYWLKSDIGRAQLEQRNASTTLGALYKDDCKDIPVITMPFPEQQSIASYLDKKTALIDEAIAKKQKLIQLLQEERTALINKAITRGIVDNVQMKPSGVEWLGDIPEHWAVKKLKYVAKINPAKGASGFNKDSETPVIFLPMERVGEDGSYNTELRKPINELWNGFTYFEEGDIIIAKITPCFENGKGALLKSLQTDIGFGSTEFHVLRAQKVILSEFLFLITRSNSFMTIGEASMYGAGGQKRVPTEFLDTLLLALPPVDEQLAIVRSLEMQGVKTNATIKTIQKEIILLQEYRTALINEVVTGKVCIL